MPLGIPGGSGSRRAVATAYSSSAETPKVKWNCAIGDPIQVAVAMLQDLQIVGLTTTENLLL